MRSLLVPETVQTSMMDCGPASLKALLEGFGVAVSYGRLREACQTDVDGTSIPWIEETAVQLSLDAQREMCRWTTSAGGVGALPAMVVRSQTVARRCSGWRQHDHWLQLMDPATGDGLRASASADIYVHAGRPMAAWRSGRPRGFPHWAADAIFGDIAARRAS